ncbi:MAG: glutaminase [Balneolaceae bacterium]|nr:glutaminase [Balneolaceae bacterium]
MDYSEEIRDIYEVVKNNPNKGDTATYIPELADVDPDSFGIHITTIDGDEFGIGDYKHRFSIQSIVKVLTLSLAYKMLGKRIWNRLGVEPSGTAFNSLVQLEADNGIPRNPFINAGALVICDILISKLNNPKADFLAFLKNFSGNPGISYSDTIAKSEKSKGYRNIALCNFIKSFQNIDNDPNEVLNFYFDICSIKMNCNELSRTFLLYANNGRKVSDNTQILTISQSKRIKSVMQTCGFYDESGEFTFKVGLPGKSGVGGGIVAVCPKKYAISIWSPKLNSKGNSYRGMKFLELFTTRTETSIF